METRHKPMTQPPSKSPAPTSPGVPHSREAEEAVIGSVIINPDCFVDLYFLKSNDFYIHRNQWIWQAYIRLHERRVPIDLLTLSEELEKNNQLAEIGGSAYLTSLINQVPTSLNAEVYGKIVEENAIRRNLISSANEIAKLAYNGESVDLITESANASLTKALYRDNENEKSLKSNLSLIYDKALNNSQRIAEGLPVEVGLTTGWTDLDIILLGIENEENFLVAAETGVGKSAFMDNFAVHLTKNLGKSVAIFSMEMSAEQRIRRMAASLAEVDSQKIKTGRMDEQEWKRFTCAIETIESLNLHMMDSSFLTPTKLRSKCTQLMRTVGLDIIMVDYLQLMGAGIKTDNRTQEVGYISRQMKLINTDLGIPTMSAAQLNRQGTQRADKRPILADLKDSSNLEQDANGVIFLWNDKNSVDKKNVTEVIVAKRRDGALGSCELIYRPAFTKFVNATSKVFSFNSVNESVASYAQSASVGSED